jgi:AraC-like DNA-binding protein/quercetin dioxygenase-like cupin family protein
MISQAEALTFKYVEVLKTRKKSDHRHPQIEILAVKSGTGNWIVGDSMGEFHEGDIFVLGSGLEHTFFPSPEAREEIKVHILHFMPETVTRVLSTFPEFRTINDVLASASRGLRLQGKTLAAAMPLVRRIAEQLPASPRRLGLFIALLAEIASGDEIKSLTSLHRTLRMRDGIDEKLDRVCKLIESHLVNPLSQASIASAVDMSPAAFSRWFKRRVGKPYSDYLNETRIDLVCRALMESDKGISRLVQECGFAGGSHFNKLFKAQKGVSPSEYRRLAQIE